MIVKFYIAAYRAIVSIVVHANTINRLLSFGMSFPHN
eukprot:jgi/Antlo1/893/1602